MYRLLKRHNLSLRKPSYIGQKLPINAKNEYYDFLYETVKIRKKYGIGDKFDLIVIVMKHLYILKWLKIKL